jgi:hypothetical protein
LIGAPERTSILADYHTSEHVTDSGQRRLSVTCVARRRWIREIIGRFADPAKCDTNESLAWFLQGRWQPIVVRRGLRISKVLFNILVAHKCSGEFHHVARNAGALEVADNELGRTHQCDM